MLFVCPCNTPYNIKSINPQENVVPIQIFKICINANDKPANPQCKINNPGAINKNVNSIGSVIPVRNDVNAAENSHPPTIFLFSGFAQRYIA